MNQNEEVPDNLGGLGDLLPADVLKMVNDLLEQLHRAEHQQPGGSNIINIYASGSQHIDNQYVFDGKVLEKSFNTNQREGESKSEIPPPEAMVWAVEKTIKDGHWWGNVSWSVVYRIYQMKGYQGTVSQFDDAVGKPIRTGKISRSLDKWAEDGASSQFIILGKELMKALAQFRK